MGKKRILFITGSAGLGHLTRDLAIAEAIRHRCPDIELSWLAFKTLIPLLKEEGENVLPEAKMLVDGNTAVENAAQTGFRLNIPKVVQHHRSEWTNNVEVFRQVIEKSDFDLVIGDEVYELVLAIIHSAISIKPTFLSIYDFLGLEPMGPNPLERLACYLMARKFAKTVPERVVTYAYVGEEEDVINKPWGFLLPNRRQWARDNCHFIGYITRFNPDDLKDALKIRNDLGYDNKPLVVCSIGGTAVGKELLKLCVKAYPLVRSKLPELRMILVCGPRLDPELLQVPEGPEMQGYVPDLYKHFAACDLAIVQGGGTSTLELTALQKPFLYFPLEKHYEQQVYVAGRLERHRAGVKMRFSKTTPEMLAEAVLDNLGHRVDYPSIPVDGANNIAEMVSRMLA